MSHKYGQVFLTDNNILRKICDVSEIGKEDIAVEIGCGEGILSEALLEKAKALTIIEIDPVCIEATQARLGTPSAITYVLHDVLTYDFKGLDKFKVVANIPYYISAKIVKKLIGLGDRLDQACLMVQKEFAQKLTAKPGQKVYTSLSVFTQYFFNVKYCFSVSRNCFKPIPKVDSAVIVLSPTGRDDIDNLDAFFSVVRSVFWARRKPAVSALSKSPYVDLDKAFKTEPFVVGLGSRRGETFAMDEYIELYNTIKVYLTRFDASGI
jgi:16S rRNA (adenine1518-N6/adenine1519-N6)-dimethyltransferase